MNVIRIGGVPEYFNLPVYQAIEQGLFSREGIGVEWIEVPEGTGAMTQMLRTGELDLAILLTEGIVKSILDGHPLRIIKTFVKSPLEWGVHVPFSDKKVELGAMEKKSFAISRPGSGSHLMAILLAQQKGWKLENLKFEQVNTLEGARESFRKGESEIFLWERYTTQFLVDQHEFSRVDNIETLWPCFVIAATHERIEKYSQKLKKVCEVLNLQCEEAQHHPSTAAEMANRFGLSASNVADILSQVKWATDMHVESAMIQSVLDAFQSVALFSDRKKPEEFICAL